MGHPIALHLRPTALYLFFMRSRLRFLRRLCLFILVTRFFFTLESDMSAADPAGAAAAPLASGVAAATADGTAAESVHPMVADGWAERAKNHAREPERGECRASSCSKNHSFPAALGISRLSGCHESMGRQLHAAPTPSGRRNTAGRCTWCERVPPVAALIWRHVPPRDETWRSCRPAACSARGVVDIPWCPCRVWQHTCITTIMHIYAVLLTKSVQC